MNRKILYGIIIAVGLITLLAYFSERGGRNSGSPPGSQQPGFEAGRQPGDQRVRDQERRGRQGGGNTGAQAQGGQARGGRMQSAGMTAQGPEGVAPGRGGGKAVTGRVGNRGSGSHGTVGTDNIPVFVNGVQKGELNGQKLLEMVPEVSVGLRRGARSGWAVTEALKLAGVSEGTRAKFVDRQGKVLTIQWNQLTSPDPAIIFSFSQGGQLVLVSGKAMESETTGKRNSKTKRLNRATSPEEAPIEIHDIVKIEVIRG